MSTTPNATQEPPIRARLLYDGGDAVYVPPEMGTARPDQLRGTPREVAAELAGRACYDSLGQGRGSDEYHPNIKAQNHLAIYEHTPVVVQLFNHVGQTTKALVCLAQRPGVTFVMADSFSVRVTIDFRAAMEWRHHTPDWLHLIEADETARSIGLVLAAACAEAAPRIVDMPDEVEVDRGTALTSYSHGYSTCHAVEPRHPSEQWVSLFMVCSRACSLEQIRHDWETAYFLPHDEDVGISQRSTRYVNEAEAPYVAHPLVRAFYGEAADGPVKAGMQEAEDAAIQSARGVYEDHVGYLQEYLKGKGVPAVAARKQARGAARGFLGNAIETQFVFSASVRQWAHMLRLRASPHADAEIRVLYAGLADGYPCVFEALRASRYGAYFETNFRLDESPDGIGRVVNYLGG